MKKYLILITLLSSCDNSEMRLSEMQKPVIVIAKSDSISIIIRDANGKILVADRETYFGFALINSYSVGDTVK